MGQQHMAPAKRQIACDDSMGRRNSRQREPQLCDIKVGSHTAERHEVLEQVWAVWASAPQCAAEARQVWVFAQLLPHLHEVEGAMLFEHWGGLRLDHCGLLLHLHEPEDRRSAWNLRGPTVNT